MDTEILYSLLILGVFFTLIVKYKRLSSMLTKSEEERRQLVKLNGDLKYLKKEFLHHTHLYEALKEDFIEKRNLYIKETAEFHNTKKSLQINNDTKIIALQEVFKNKNETLEKEFENKKMTLEKDFEEKQQILEMEFKNKNTAILGELKNRKEILEKEFKNTQEALQNKLEDRHNVLLEKFRNKQEVLQKEIEDKELILKYLQEDIIKKFPWFAQAFADYELARDFSLARNMAHKIHPAHSAAEDVKRISTEKTAWVRRAKEAEYKLAYFESVVPVLTELEEDPIPQKIETNIAHSDEDPVKLWISKDEYYNLSVVERNQLALDNYKKRHKTKWEIGREYERYVGYLYEQQGYKVEYNGILAGLEDLGRDLVCKQNNEIIIIQCKNWSSKKTIHEKHINQLFGTYMHYMITYTKKDNITQRNLFNLFDLAENINCKACFFTSTSLSQTGRDFADALGIEYRENQPLSDFPMIKCNVNRTTDEKIYHLPIDINYDNVVIEPDREEFYAFTVKEAESKGFRRAYKWHGN